MARQIDAEALKEAFSNNCLHNCYYCKLAKWDKKGACYNCGLIDLAPTCNNLQGEYVDISKLRLMTVEECAGHTIDYAMGWKACIEWIKKGGAV